MFKPLISLTLTSFLLSATASAEDLCGASTGSLDIEEYSQALDSVAVSKVTYHHGRHSSSHNSSTASAIHHVVDALTGTTHNNNRRRHSSNRGATNNSRHATTNTTTSEQSRSRAASTDWDRLRHIRSLLKNAQFPGGPDSFLASVAQELSRSSMKNDFINAYNKSSRGVTLRYTYSGNPVSVYIPGTDLDRAVDILYSAAHGNLNGYQFHAPPSVNSSATPLELRLFSSTATSSATSTQSLMHWTALTVASAINPNHNLSTHSGWHSRHHHRP